MDKPANIGVLEEFRLEFLDSWKQLPNKTLFFVLFAAWLLLFHVFGNSTASVKSPSLLDWLYLVCKPNTTAERDDTQGLIAPFVVLALLWWKRKELLAIEFRLWKPALLIIGSGLVLHLLGFRIQQPRISVLGLVIGIYGMMGLAWGPAWLRKSIFPLCLLLFCIPLGTLSQPITFRLRLLVCQIVEFISHYILQIDLIRIGTSLRDPANQYQYEVAPACSGIRSLITTVGLAFIYGMMSFRTWWKRGVVFLSAVPLAVLGNVLRMLTIVIAAEIGGQHWGDTAHENWIVSLIPYLLVFVGLLALGYWLRTEDAPTGQDVKQPAMPSQVRGYSFQPWPTVAVALLMIFCSGLLLLRLQTGDKLSRPGVKTYLADNILQVQLPEQALDFTSEKVPIDATVTNILPRDTSYGQRIYTSSDGFQVLVNVVLMGGDRTSLHKPQICLTGQGWQLDPTPSPTKITMDRPYPYDLPVLKLTGTREFINGSERAIARGIYVYWFVSDGTLSADASGFKRMWLMSRDLLRTGTLQRWAYVSYFAVCPPGQEDATFERMKKLIVASVPEFQLTPAPREVKITSR